MTLEERIEKLTALVVEQQRTISALDAKLDKLATDVKPKLLDAPAVADMLGLTAGALRQHKHRQSKLWRTLEGLAVVGLDGRPAWRPGDIVAHCKPWLGAADDGGAE